MRFNARVTPKPDMVRVVLPIGGGVIAGEQVPVSVSGESCGVCECRVMWRRAKAEGVRSVLREMYGGVLPCESGVSLPLFVRRRELVAADE